MRATAALGAFVLVVAAFALLAPASLLDRQIASATEGRVRLAAASGTVWRGRGIVSDAQGRWRAPVGWRVDAWPLLRGAFSVTLLPSESADLRGSVLAEGETLRVSGLHVELPATALESAWKRPPVPRLDGLVSVDAPAFNASSNRAEGGFDMRWSQAGVAFAGLRAALGTVNAHGHSEGDALLIDLSNAGGDAALRGTATVQPGAVAVDATLRPLPSMAPAVALALRALGPTDPDGTVHLRWQARR